LGGKWLIVPGHVQQNMQHAGEPTITSHILDLVMHRGRKGGGCPGARCHIISSKKGIVRAGWFVLCSWPSPCLFLGLLCPFVYCHRLHRTANEMISLAD